MRRTEVLPDLTRLDIVSPSPTSKRLICKMMAPESLWIAQRIIDLTESAISFEMLNVGSSTKHFREVSHPHIHENIFKPIRERCRVVHLDVKAQDGVDLVGDLTDPNFLEQLKLRHTV